MNTYVMGGRLSKTTIHHPDSTLKDTIFLTDVNAGYSLVNDHLLMYDATAINNMIVNLLLTSPGERDFEPTFGSNIPHMLFEPCDEISAYRMETMVFDAIKQWIPFISLITSECFIMPTPAMGLFQVTLTYVINATNQKEIFTGALEKQ